MPKLWERLGRGAANERAAVKLKASEAGIADDQLDDFADEHGTVEAAEAALAARSPRKQSKKAKPLDPKDVIARVKAVGLEADIATDLIAEGATSEMVTDRICEVQVERGDSHEYAPQSRPRVGVGYDGSDPAVMRDQIGAALAAKAMGKRPEGGGERFASMSLADAAAWALRQAGERHVPSGHDAITAVMTVPHTRSDFPKILGNSVERIMSDRMAQVASELTMCARQMDAPDFRARNVVRLSSDSAWEAVGEAAEIPHTTLVEGAEAAPLLDTYARQIAVSRQLLINDDIGAFAQVGMKLADGAVAMIRDKLATAVTSNPNLSDGTSVFDASRGNVGTSAAISVTSISDAITKMRRFRGLNNEVLGIRPRYLVVAPEQELEARQLLSPLDASEVSNVNPYDDLLQLVVEPALPDGAWYVFADPAITDGLAYSFLSGNGRPTVQTDEMWDSLGVSVRGYLDFGVAWIDWRGALKNEGGA